MATFKAVILSGGRHTKSDGTTNIKIRITHKRKIAHIPTELYTIPRNMDNASGQLTKGQNMQFINLRITDWLQKCRRYDIQLGNKRDLLSVLDLKKGILFGEENPSGIDFYKFVDQLINETRKKGTADQYRFAAASIKKFAGPNLKFLDINLNFLRGYENFLYNNDVGNGIINYMTTFRAIFNKGRDFYNDEDIGNIRIPHYPFRKYKMPKRKNSSKDHVLTPEEMRLLLKYKPQNPGEEFAKDMFLLMFYLVGIESVDLYHLRKHKKRIVYERFKTGGEFSIKLEPEAKEIIKKYAGQNTLLNVSERFKSPQVFLRYINNYLHGLKYRKITGIFERIEIEKKVTSKWARHSWATIARNDCQISMDDIALCLGHKNPNNIVTDMYVKHDNSIIDQANRKVIDFIFKSQSIVE